jgi:drug/metabolite transporter (DMT)-like permease
MRSRSAQPSAAIPTPEEQSAHRPSADASGGDSLGVVSAGSQLGWLTFWMSGTLISFIVGALSVRALADHLTVFEMMSVRCAGSLILMTALGVLMPELLASLKWRRMRLQATRGVIHFGSQICWALAITLLPLATVFSLEFTIPAWVALLAVLFLGERMTVHRALGLAVCFIGVLVILRPGFEAFRPAALIMLLGALLFAITAIMTKKLITTESTFAILFWMNLIQLPLNFFGNLLPVQPNFPPQDLLFFADLEPWMTLPLIGCTLGGLLVHYCLTNAFRCGDAIVVIPMDFLRVPIIAVIGWFFYNEHLDVFVFAGAAMIVGGVLWNVRAEAQRNSRLAQPVRGPLIQPAE